MESQANYHTAPSDAWLDAIDAAARRILGPRDKTGRALAEEVAKVSAAYTRDRGALARDAASPAARARFFLPRDLPKIQAPLRELATLDLLPHHPPRILDLAAGYGATSLGIGDGPEVLSFAQDLSIFAVDRDPLALRFFEALAAVAPGPRRNIRTRVADITRPPLEGEAPFDLILLGFVLNELSPDIARRVALLEQLLTHLTPGGSLIILEPALRDTTRALMQVRDALAPHVFAPCTHHAPCPMLAPGRERDWCHEDRDIALNPRLAEIARAAGLRWEGLTYSYLTLRRDGRSIGELATHRVVSNPIRTKGKLELWACSTAGLSQIRRLDRQRGPETAAIDRAQRGDLLSERDGRWHSAAQGTPRKD